MSDEQIAAALVQERRTATDKIPIEELVTTEIVKRIYTKKSPQGEALP